MNYIVVRLIITLSFPLLVILSIHFFLINDLELSISIGIIIFPWLFFLLYFCILQDDLRNTSLIKIHGYPSSLEYELKLIDGHKSKLLDNSAKEDAILKTKSSLITLESKTHWFAAKYKISLLLNKKSETKKQIVIKAVAILSNEVEKTKKEKRTFHRLEAKEKYNYMFSKYEYWDEVVEHTEFIDVADYNAQMAAFWDAYELYNFSQEKALKDLLNKKYLRFFPPELGLINDWKTRLKLERKIGISIKNSLINFIGNFSYIYRIKERFIVFIIIAFLVNCVTLIPIGLYFELIHEFAHPYIKDIIDLSHYHQLFLRLNDVNLNEIFEKLFP